MKTKIQLSKRYWLSYKSNYIINGRQKPFQQMEIYPLRQTLRKGWSHSSNLHISCWYRQLYHRLQDSDLFATYDPSNEKRTWTKMLCRKVHNCFCNNQNWFSRAHRLIFIISKNTDINYFYTSSFPIILKREWTVVGILLLCRTNWRQFLQRLPSYWWWTAS